MSNQSMLRFHRRQALKLMGLAAAAPAGFTLTAVTEKHLSTDPNLLNPSVPWSYVLNDHERKTIAALLDLILPADPHSPSAGSVGVADFIDEWVSAPYPQQDADRRLIRGGILWLDRESRTRFDHEFIETTREERQSLAGDIRLPETASPPLQLGARFFSRIRRLAIIGFYSTPAGWKDIGYVGNRPLKEFSGPPPEVLTKLQENLKSLGLE